MKKPLTMQLPPALHATIAQLPAVEEGAVGYQQALENAVQRWAGDFPNKQRQHHYPHRQEKRIAFATASPTALGMIARRDTCSGLCIVAHQPGEQKALLALADALGAKRPTHAKR